MKKGRDIFTVLIMVALVILPLVFIPYIDGDRFSLPKVYLLRLIAVAYLFVIYKYRNNLKEIISTDWINRLLLLYFGWLMLSTVFSINPIRSIVGNYERIEGLSTIMLYIILFLIARKQGDISKKNINWMLITGCVVMVYGILQSYGIGLFPISYTDYLHKFPISTIGNPNFIGSYIVLLLPFAAYKYLVEKNKLGLLAYTVLFYGLLSTMTRGAWLGAFVSIVIFGVLILYYKAKFNIRFKDIAWITSITILCFVVFDISKSGSFMFRFLSIYLDIDELISGGDRLEMAGTNRIFIWIRVVELIKMRPIFGFGLENLHIAFIHYFNDDLLRLFGKPTIVDKAHNEYLHIAVSTGIPALLIYLSFLFSVVRKGVTKLLDLPYAIPLFVAVIGYMVQAFFNISVVSVAYIFWIFLGFLASSKLIETDQN